MTNIIELRFTHDDNAFNPALKNKALSQPRNGKLYRS